MVRCTYYSGRGMEGDIRRCYKKVRWRGLQVLRGLTLEVFLFRGVIGQNESAVLSVVHVNGAARSERQFTAVIDLHDPLHVILRFRERRDGPPFFHSRLARVVCRE